ncbi:MAG: dipeptidase [Gammaproteobacteria bacterium]|nr:dipeptidase [Gammaproteobacteria bacterium]
MDRANISKPSLATNLLRTLLVGLLLVATGCVQGESDAQTPVTLATEIQDEILTLDSHIDIPLNFATGYDDAMARPGEQVDLESMREGGLKAGFFIVYVGQGARDEEGYAKAKADARTKFDAIRRMTNDQYPDHISLAVTAADVERLQAEGKLIALIGIENGYVIGKDLSLIATYRDLGARYMTLVHNGHNDIGDSAQPRPALGDGTSEHGGLSDFGREVIGEMNRVGMLVDISHVSKATMLQATAASEAPVIASHSSVNGVFEHVRNLDDEQLDAIKVAGGVVQIVAFDSYLKAVPTEKREALNALRQVLGLTSPGAFAGMDDTTRANYRQGRAMINQKWPGADVSDLVNHIDYAVQRIGIDHVGISSDFGGGGGVEGWNHALETSNVTLELVRRGYSRESITKLWGGNLLRVMRVAEQTAEQLQAG